MDVIHHADELLRPIEMYPARRGNISDMTGLVIRVLLAILLVCALGGGSSCANLDIDGAPGESAVGDKWALVVGISRFKDPTINLKYAAKDANDFAGYLVKEAGFAADHVRVLTDDQATQKRIMSELGSKWLPRVAAPDDLVVIFISSHGSPEDMDVQGVNYIVAHDSDPADLYTTAIEMQDLMGTITRRVHAKRIVVFLDSCHSGAASAASSGAKGIKRTTNFDLSSVPMGVGQFIISSSEQNQLSWELKDQPNGAFTYALLDTLRKKRDVPLPELYRSLKDTVQQTVLRERGVVQTPVYKSSWTGAPVSLNVVASNPHPGLESSAVVATKPLDSGVRVDVAPIAPPAALPNSIAILPIPAMKNVHIREIPPNTKVVWGQIKNADELQGLPTKLDEDIFQKLRAKFGERVLGPHSTRDGLEEGKLLNAAVNQPALTAENWKRIGAALQAKYMVAATIDEVGWDTSVMANKYTLVVSAKLIDGESGQQLAELKDFAVKKAPFHGDVTGGRKYFENQVAPEAAQEIAKRFSKELNAKN